MHAQLPKPFAMHPLLPATPSHRAKPKGTGRPAANLPSQANLGFIFHSPPSEAEELSLLQKTLPTLSLEQKASAERSSTRGTCSHSCRQLKGRLLMENIQQFGQQADSVTNCSLKLPSESSDPERSAFAGPKRGRRWHSYEATVWLETMHPVQGLGRGDSAPT